jgi:flagellar motility protein MotE (MotC chaperone)
MADAPRPDEPMRVAADPRPAWRRLLVRPSLLSLTAAAVGISAIAHAVTVAGTTEIAGASAAPPTRMGVSIQQSLAERDQDLARRTRAAILREQSMRAAEQRLKAELQARQAAANPAAGTATGNPAEVPQPIEDLARIYQTMRPARAAPIFAALDLDVQTQIARRMRERAMALIMANMPPDAAVRLSMALAGRRPALTQISQVPATMPMDPPRARTAAEPVLSARPAGALAAGAGPRRAVPRVPQIAAPRTAQVDRPSADRAAMAEGAERMAAR